MECFTSSAAHLWYDQSTADIAEDCTGQKENSSRIFLDDPIWGFVGPQNWDAEEEEKRNERSHALGEISHFPRLVFVGSIQIVEHHGEIGESAEI